MKYDPKKHHRRSIRLKGYDYSQAGAYFVTICAKDRQCLFGEIQQGEMYLNDLGKIVYDAWHDLPNHYLHMELDAFVIMPNHIHGIIALSDMPMVAGNTGDVMGDVGAGLKPAPTAPTAPTATTTIKRQPLSEIVRALKTFSSRRINEYRNKMIGDETQPYRGVPVWQRNYYEHIIREDDSLNRIRQYIVDNPKNWNKDQQNPINKIAPTQRDEINQ